MLKIFNKILLTIVLVSFVTIMTACTDYVDNQRVNNVNLKEEKVRLEEANKNWVQHEKAVIDEFIKNSGKEFVETGTGLRYRIVNHGEGILIKTGDVVTMEYEMGLLNGDIVYSSDNEGLRILEVGRGGVESGLEEALLHLHRGDSAEIIIPSYLAHGLTGDGDRIPPRSIILYKVRIINN